MNDTNFDNQELNSSESKTLWEGKQDTLTLLICNLLTDVIFAIILMVLLLSIQKSVYVVMLAIVVSVIHIFINTPMFANKETTFRAIIRDMSYRYTLTTTEIRIKGEQMDDWVRTYEGFDYAALSQSIIEKICGTATIAFMQSTQENKIVPNSFNNNDMDILKKNSAKVIISMRHIKNYNNIMQIISEQKRNVQ